jgi:ATP-binding cassette subfamily B protein
MVNRCSLTVFVQQSWSRKGLDVIDSNARQGLETAEGTVAGNEPRARGGLRRLRPFLGRHRALLVALVLTSLASGAFEAGILALVAQVAEALVNGKTRVIADVGPFHLEAGLGPLLAVAVGLAVMRLAVAVVVAYLPARISADAQASLRNDIFSAFTNASWSVQAEEREGHLQELMTGHIAESSEGVYYAAVFVSAGFTFLALVIAALVLSLVAALVVIAAAGILLLALRPLNDMGLRYAQSLSRAGLDYASGINEAVGLAEETKVFGVGRAQRHRQEKLVDRARLFFFRTQFVGRLVQGTYQGAVILLLIGGLTGLYLAGAEHIAVLGAVILMLIRSASYGQQAQGSYHQVLQASPFLDRLRAAEVRYRASAPKAGDQPLPKVVAIGFEKVDFAYRVGQEVISEVTFAVSAGEAIGIVGPSGAGKSTMLQLLLRLREPTSGRFVINGEPAAEMSLEEWHRHVAYVPQEPRLVHATVADNIRYLREIDDAAVERAARLAHIHDDILAMPEGYASVVGQRADAVSGGQRQRICLARALAGDPEILLLDEPTSALDLRSEFLVQESLAGLRGRITVFIVAHRLSTLTICDRLMVMDDGVLEAFGPTAEIERTNTFYRSAAALTADIGTVRT